jgi:hypothetical protein
MKKTRSIKIAIIMLSITLALSFVGCASEQKSNEVNQGNKTNQISYKLYEGAWKVDREIKDPQNTVETLLEIKVIDNGEFNGTLTSARIVKGNPNRIAQVDVKGKIINNVANFDFNDDSWGHAGNVKIEFQENKIVATIIITKEPREVALWGIEKGTLNFVKGKE